MVRGNRAAVGLSRDDQCEGLKRRKEDLEEETQAVVSREHAVKMDVCSSSSSSNRKSSG